ncbi:MAG: alanine racemase [Patescibacteria group bacterium]
MNRRLYPSWVEISRSAIRHNLRQLKKLIPQSSKFMAVIKANAYGHDMKLMAPVLASMGVRWFGVASLEEALALRPLVSHSTRIQVLSYYRDDLLTTAITRQIRLTVYSYDAARRINSIAQRHHTRAYLHLKVDTGTSRLGVLPNEVVAIAQHIRGLSHCVLEGIFSHLADAENPNQRVTQTQLRVFTRVLESLTKNGLTIPIRHIACSAATILNKKSHFDMVRMGISLYGLWSIESSRTHVHPGITLKPALSWYARIIQIKRLSRGTAIGYGQTYRVRRPMTIAVLPVGYWDGYDRRLSNKGYVLIKGKKCPIRGRICMNLCMVDVSSIPDIRAGDKATLIGYNNNKHISVEILANLMGTINYEVVTRINHSIPRILTS